MNAMTTIDAPTPAELLRAQDEGGVEYVGGKIVHKPASNISSSTAVRIIQLLGLEADKTGYASVFEASLGYQCFPDDPGKFRKPDVSVVRVERLKALLVALGLMTIPADLAVEVNSAYKLAFDVFSRVDEYLDAGFKIVWVVDPPTRSVTVYRADGSVSRLREHQEITGETAMPTFKCRVGEFFRKPGA
jgi:Uma2 family endonuclease